MFCNRLNGKCQISIVKIGSHQDGTKNYDGMIDDFRIYDYELSESEIDNVYNE